MANLQVGYRERRETRHNISPPTKKLRLRLGWGRGGVWVEVGLGWGSAIMKLTQDWLGCLIRRLLGKTDHVAVWS